jgi:hypothetical protein
VSPVAHGFLTNVIDDINREDTRDIHLFKEKNNERDVKERAIVKLQEVSEGILTPKQINILEVLSGFFVPKITFPVCQKSSKTKM